MKAIETVYKGYRFRSRLEARWAVFFDKFGIEWIYEPEGFDLGEIGWYLPDFYLPETQWFVEVKGIIDDEEGLEKSLYLDNYPPIGIMGCLLFKELEYAKSYFLEGGWDFNNAFLKFQRITPIESSKTITDYNNAITKARQARFEHGETPIV